MAGPPVTPRLVDLAGDWLAACAALRRATEITDPAPLRARAHELRAEFEQAARAAGHNAVDIQDASFALAAFFDESVMLRARGAARDTWGARKLQLEWFSTNSAGEEFFSPRLDGLRRDRERRIEPLEVYAASVALGFTGRFGLAPDRLPPLLKELWIDVQAVRGQASGPLAPHAVLAEPVLPQVAPRVPRWVTAVVFLAAVVLVWTVVALWSGASMRKVETGVADQVNRLMEAGGH